MNEDYGNTIYNITSLLYNIYYIGYMKTGKEIHDKVQKARKRYAVLQQRIEGAKRTLDQIGSISKICSYLMYVGWDFRTDEDDKYSGEFQEEKIMGFKTKHQINWLLFIENFPEHPTNLELLSGDIYGDNILEKGETALEFVDVLVESFNKDKSQLDYWNQFDDELNMYYGKEDKVEKFW